MKIWEKDNNKVYDNVHFSTESKERILDELMKEIDKEFDEEGVKKEGNVDRTWEIRRNEKMKKNNTMKKFMKTSVAAAFAVAASGAILWGVNNYVNSGNGKSVAKQIETTESVKETERDTEQETKKEVSYATIKGVEGEDLNKIGEGFYKFLIDCDKEVVVGDATFTCDRKKGVIVKNGDEFAEIGIKFDEESTIALDVITDGNVVYYNKGADIVKYDIKTKEKSKVCTIPVKNEEETGSFANVFAFAGDNIICNAGVNDWWCTEVFMFDQKTNKATKVSDGCAKFLEGDSLLIQRQFVSDVSPVPYDVYKIDGDKVEKTASIIESGLFNEKTDDKYYFFEFNYDNKETHLVRCNFDGSDVERVADLSKGRDDLYEIGAISGITDTYCIYNGVKFTY